MRHCGPTTEYHFFEAHYPIIRHVRGIGFLRHQRIGDFYVFQKVEQAALVRQSTLVMDQIRYNRFTHEVSQVVRRLVGAL